MIETLCSRLLEGKGSGGQIKGMALESFGLYKKQSNVYFSIFIYFVVSCGNYIVLFQYMKTLLPSYHILHIGKSCLNNGRWSPKKLGSKCQNSLF